MQADKVTRNPLRHGGRAFHLPDFPAIRPEHVMPALEELLQAYRDGSSAKIAVCEQPDWSIVEAEIEWSDALDRAWSPVSHLKAVVDSEELRKAYNEGLQKLPEHANWRQHHKGIYRAYRSLRESPAFAGFDPAQRRIVELELRDFHLEGVDLDEDDQRSYHELVMRLSELGAKFAPALVERCYRAWKDQSPIHLHYRNDMGMEQAAPILAARNVETPDGHVLLLWVYLDHDKVEYEIDKGEDESDEDNYEYREDRMKNPVFFLGFADIL